MQPIGSTALDAFSNNQIRIILFTSSVLIRLIVPTSMESFWKLFKSSLILISPSIRHTFHLMVAGLWMVQVHTCLVHLGNVCDEILSYSSSLYPLFQSSMSLINLDIRLLMSVWLTIYNRSFPLFLFILHSFESQIPSKCS
jgi:ABC-type glucose/galactose transport system permease subunit